MKAGADKVSINSQAIKNPQILYDAIKIFGKSTIVVNIEVIKKKMITFVTTVMEEHHQI